jgi:hypothetical protein
MADDLCLLVVGNAIDGLRFIGPFDDAEEAGNYAEVHERHELWHIATLEALEPSICCADLNPQSDAD